jgi:hypothetical protein
MTSLRQIYAYQRARSKAHTVSQRLLLLFQLLYRPKIFFFAKQSHLIPAAKPTRQRSIRRRDAGVGAFRKTSPSPHTMPYQIQNMLGYGGRYSRHILMRLVRRSAMHIELVSVGIV